MDAVRLPSEVRTPGVPGQDVPRSAGDLLAGQGNAVSPVSLPGGCVQRVSPAGSGQETRWVLLTALLVVLFCAAVVGWQHQWQASGGLQSHQLDLAADLGASEQGVYTDLQVVHDEWVATGENLPPPTPAQWAAEGWAPFADDLSERQRGQRIWHLLTLGGHCAYLGIPAAIGGEPQEEGAPVVSKRLILWRLPEKQRLNTGMSSSGPANRPPFDVWVREGEEAPPGEEPLSERLDDADLIAHGWRQVVVRRRQGNEP